MIQRFALLLLLVFSMTVAAAPRLPEMGDASSSALSDAEAQRLGRSLYQKLLKEGRLVEDPEVVAYVGGLGQRLANASGGGQFRFFVVDEQTINAFAAPGGYIGVNAGLILSSRDEDELAAVLAHEVAHITQHHMARTYEAARNMSVPTAAALLAAIVLGSADPEAGSAALAGAVAGQAQMQINFTRDNEREADRVGMNVLQLAGFDAAAMPRFFERLQRESRYYDDQIPEFLRTHPVTIARIADASARVPTTQHLREVDTPDFWIAQVRLRAHDEVTGAEAGQRYRAELKSGVSDGRRVAALYGLALAQRAQRRYVEAKKTLESLNGTELLALRMEVARLAQAMGNTDEALEHYAAALRLYPEDLPLLREYALTLLAADRAVAARQLLMERVRKGIADDGLYALLARASRAAGQMADSYYYLAEAHHARGDDRGALDQIERGLREPDLNGYQRQRLTAQRDALKEQIQEGRDR